MASVFLWGNDEGPDLPPLIEAKKTHGYSLRKKDKHQSQNNSVGNDIEFFRYVKDFGENGQKAGPKEGPPDTPHSSHDDHGDHLNRVVKIKISRTNEDNVVGIEASCERGEHRTHHEDLYLISVCIDAQGIGGYLTAVDSFQRSSYSGVDQIE